MIRTKNIVITAEMLSYISKIDEFRGKWQVTQDLAPDRLTSLKRVATIESVGSSTRIEGAKLTDEQVEILLARLEQQSFTTRDEQEVAGYANAMDMIFENYQQMTLTENHIKQLHGVLLKYSRKDEEHRGSYKLVPNNVEAFDANGKSLGVVFQTATPFETPRQMQELVEWYNTQIHEEKQHPLLLVGIFIVMFLAIHPFKDGNGRLSRILTSLLLLRAGYSYIPYSSMETVIEANKDGYYRALRRTQQTLQAEAQDFEPWLAFFLKMMVRQKDNLVQKLVEEHSFREVLPALSRMILGMVEARGEVTVRAVESASGASRNTIKAHLKRLTEQDYLRLVGSGRGVRYLSKVKD